ncbi:tRNA (adenine(58)-N(1))-methyltransferase non-catalytic subunit trm6 [Hypoxylon texense]
MTSKRQSTMKSSEAEANTEAETECDSRTPSSKYKRRKFRCRKIKSPEVGSLYDILHDSSGSALYVPPFCWTDQHTRLLGRFVQLPPQSDQRPALAKLLSSQRSQRLEAHPKLVEIIGHLDTMMMEGSSHLRQSNSIQALMEVFFPNRLSRTTGELTMRCGSDRYSNAIRCQAMWKCINSPLSFDSATASIASSSESLAREQFSHVKAPYNTPVLAYVSRTHLNFMRRNCFRILPFPDGSFNTVIHRLQQVRARKLIPQNPDEDQYILATMIAMAQQHVYASMFTGFGFAPKDIRVAVITMSRDEGSFIIYSAVISTAFLHLFQYPDKAPPGDPKITVEYQHVSVWPVLGLKERLGRALGEDIVGDVDYDSIESFEDVPEDDNDRLDKEINAVSLSSRPSGGRTPNPCTSRVTPPKRKVLSEVFNKSFSEDRDSADFPSELLTKRRCLAEGMGDKQEATLLLPPPHKNLSSHSSPGETQED